MCCTLPGKCFAWLLYVSAIILLLPLLSASSQSAAPLHNRKKQAEDTVQSLYAEGERDFSQGDYTGAAQKFKEALALEPHSPQLLNNLGVAYHMEGHFPQAVEALRAALQLNPKLVSANLILGLDLVRLGRPQQAITALENVLTEQPGNRDGLMGLASAFFATNQFEEASHVYLKEVAIRPSDSDAWYGLGICFEHLSEDVARGMARTGAHSPYYYRLIGEFLLSQGADIDAEQAFRHALALARPTDQTGLHAALGFVLMGQSQLNEAKASFRTELRLNRGNLDAKLGLAAISLDEGNIDGALKELCTVYRVDSGFYLAHLGSFAASLDSAGIKAARQLKPVNFRSDCATVLRLLQKEMANPGAGANKISVFQPSPSKAGSAGSGTARAVEEAKRSFESGAYTRCATELQMLSYRNPSVELLLARCASLSGDFYESFQASQQALKADPRNLPADYWTAEASKKLAQAAFNRAVLLNPNSWQGHVLLGDIYRQRKQWGDARSNYVQAARLKPSSPAPYLGLATIDWQNGQFGDAEVNLHKATAMGGRNIQANFEMGDILVRQHRFRGALPYLQKTAAAEPDLLAAHADLGRCYAALGEAPAAIRELTRALATDRFGDLHYLLYIQYKNQGRTALAQAALSDSQKLRARELEIQHSRLQRALRNANSRKGSL